jgi:shikimate kinase
LSTGRSRTECPRQPNLVLIGFMATGKSTIGRLCARSLGFRFRDSDTLIERRAGRPIPEIFAEEGESAFRARESEALQDLARGYHLVIATGGGAVMNAVNVARLRRTGIVILLHAAPEEILMRVGNRQSRPLLADAPDPLARIESLLLQREPYYRAAAHAIVETTGLSRETAAARVLEAYHTEAERWRWPGRLPRKDREDGETA